MGQTRGERNSNPGNINYTPVNPFLGQIGIELIPTDEPLLVPRFGLYDTDEHGIRAIAKILISYIGKDRCDTIRKICNRWAPGSDNNNVTAYINAVSDEAGIDPDHHIEINDGNLEVLVKAIIHHENGRCLYSTSQILQAVHMALTGV